MKKYLPCIAGVLLGLCFLTASIPVLFNLIKPPPMPENTPVWHFMQAFWPTGYVKFVKIFEFVGGIGVGRCRCCADGRRPWQAGEWHDRNSRA